MLVVTRAIGGFIIEETEDFPQRRQVVAHSPEEALVHLEAWAYAPGQPPKLPVRQPASVPPAATPKKR